MEQSRGALLYALCKYQPLALYPVHPSTSSDYRKAMDPSGRKDDPGDADLLLDLLTLHRGRLRALEPDTEATRKLQALVEKRRQLVEERTAQTNRITHQLKLYFPQVLEWFDDLSAPIVAAFLERWPTLPRLLQEAPAAVRAFFHQQGSRSPTRIQNRLQQMQQAQLLITDPAVIEPSVLLVNTLLALVAALNHGIRQLEKAIEEVVAVHPDYSIFASFPGAGPALAPRLVAAFGRRRERYQSASKCNRSAASRRSCRPVGASAGSIFGGPVPNFCGRPCHEYAALSVPHSPWAKAFYEKQKGKR